MRHSSVFPDKQAIHTLRIIQATTISDAASLPFGFASGSSTGRWSSASQPWVPSRSTAPVACVCVCRCVCVSVRAREMERETDCNERQRLYCDVWGEQPKQALGKAQIPQRHVHFPPAPFFQTSIIFQYFIVLAIGEIL